MEPFGPILKSLIKQRGMTITAFSKAAGVSRNMADFVVRNKRRPQLDQLGAWAEILGLRGNERDEFVLAGNWVHTPELIRKRLADLEAEVQRLKTRTSKPGRKKR